MIKGKLASGFEYELEDDVIDKINREIEARHQ